MAETFTTPSTLNASGRGVVKVSATGGKIAAYTSQFNATYNSGFNFIIGVSNDDGNDDGAADDSGLSDGFDNEVEQHQHSGLDK